MGQTTILTWLPAGARLGPGRYPGKEHNRHHLLDDSAYYQPHDTLLSQDDFLHEDTDNLR